MSNDNVDEVCDLSEFTINLADSVKGVRISNNAKAEALKKRMKISKLNNRLKEVVDGSAPAAAPAGVSAGVSSSASAPAGASGAPGGVASAGGGATTGDVFIQTPLGALVNAFSGVKKRHIDE
eukprot:9498905-Pyramimonas_sp.AAC.1